MLTFLSFIIRVSYSISRSLPFLDPVFLSRTTKMIHTNHRRMHTRNAHLSFFPLDRPCSLVSLSLSLSIVVSPYRVSVPVRSPPLRRIPGHVPRRPRCIPRGTSARHRLYHAQLSVRVCHRLCLTSFTQFSLLPLSSSLHIHTQSPSRFSLSFSLFLFLYLLSVEPSLPLFTWFCLSFFSSPSPTTRESRLPGRLALIPSACRRLLFFAPLSLHPPAPGINVGGGGDGGGLASRVLSRREIPSPPREKHESA